MENGSDMEKIGYLYENAQYITTSDQYKAICIKGKKAKVVNDCSDERDKHELFYHNRPGLKVKKLKVNDIVEILGCYQNMYGIYIKCLFNNETYDINPINVTFLITPPASD